MTRSHRSWSLLWLAALAVAAIAVFWGGMRSGYYADDFSYYFHPLPSNFFHYFTHENPSQVMYRPVFSTFMVAVQHLWGLEPLPIHVASLLCHVLLAWLVAISVVRLGYSRLQAMIGSAFFLVAQINTYTVLGNDTLSQVAGVLFGCLAAWMLYFPGRDRQIDGAARPQRPLPAYFLPSLLCFAVSLLMKETSTAYLGVVAVALLAANIEQSPRRKALVRTALQLLPFVLLVIAYMLVRSQYVLGGGPQIGDGRYGMNIGLNIPKNIALFLTASTTVISSVTAFVAMHRREIPMLIAIAITSAIFIALLLRGLWLCRRDRPVAVLLLLYFTCFFPVILFNHVSEVYIYNSFPFLACLTGIALGAVYMRAINNRARIALASTMASLMLLHILAVRSKSEMITANGERAIELLEKLRPLVEQAPQNGTVFMLNPPNETIEYSAYVMKDFNILIAGSPGIESYLARPDLQMMIRNPADIEAGLRESDSTMIVTLENGEVVRYRSGVPR